MKYLENFFVFFYKSSKPVLDTIRKIPDEFSCTDQKISKHKETLGNYL